MGIIEALTEAVSIGVSKLSNFSEDRGGSAALKTGSVLFSGAAWIVFASPIIGALFLLSVNVGSLGFSLSFPRLRAGVLSRSEARARKQPEELPE